MTDAVQTPLTHGDARRLLEREVGRTCAVLQSKLFARGAGHSETVAQLARLRRADVTQPGDPTVWDVTLGDLPDELRGSGDRPSHAEAAQHAALVLFAAHLQSADGPRHVQGRTLGRAMGQLARRQATDTGLDDYASTSTARRFRVFATATTYDQALGHLRGLVALMRSHAIPLDYGRLAGDLFSMQTPAGLRRLQWRWGSDFHRSPVDSTTPADTPASESTNPSTKES